ncbi:LAGLIDADG family homing endonuclease [Priestia megaterium]|nr:LAGLIDADG family homing endonuclease [Priestia megaterium]
MEKNNVKLKRKYYIKKDTLIGMYYYQMKTVSEIANAFNCNYKTIIRLMNDYGIQRRRLRNTKEKPLPDRITKSELIKLYLDEDKTFEEIGSIVGLTAATIRKWVIKWEIPRKRIHFTAKEEISREEIIEWYITQNKSVHELREKTNVNYRSIYRLLDFYGIKKRSHKESVNLYFKNNPNLNLNFIRKESGELYYFLGLLLTDGTISRAGRVEIGLIDKDVIEWIAEKLELKTSINKISSGKSYVVGRKLKKPSKPIYRISFLNQEATQLLKEYGVEPNKTYTVKFPKIIPNVFIADLIRGIFDGDGGISLSKYKTKNGDSTRCHIHFSSASEDFIKGIKQNIELLIGGNRKITIRKKGTSILYIFQFSKREDVIKFLELMYRNDAFGMGRKKQKAISFLEMTNRKFK